MKEGVHRSGRGLRGIRGGRRCFGKLASHQGTYNATECGSDDADFADRLPMNMPRFQ